MLQIKLLKNYKIFVKERNKHLNAVMLIKKCKYIKELKDILKEKVRQFLLLLNNNLNNCLFIKDLSIKLQVYYFIIFRIIMGYFFRRSY